MPGSRTPPGQLTGAWQEAQDHRMTQRIQPLPLARRRVWRTWVAYGVVGSVFGLLLAVGTHALLRGKTPPQRLMTVAATHAHPPASAPADPARAADPALAQTAPAVPADDTPQVPWHLLTESSPTVTLTRDARRPAPAAHAAPAAPAAARPPAVAAAPTFNGRPLRKARTLTMLVTAYSPDERSCGASADGITASGFSVWTNGMRMVAADTRVLPFGSVISIPGYHGGKPVPVLDRGGKIKGHRLDVLYPTHEAARHFGVRRLEVTVWDYAD